MKRVVWGFIFARIGLAVVALVVCVSDVVQVPHLK